MSAPAEAVPMRLAVAGASGRMGRELLRVVLDGSEATLAAALVRGGSGVVGVNAAVLAGLPAAGIPATADVAEALEGVDGILDFTAPALTVALGHEAARRGLVHVVGTTGLSAADDAALAEAARGGARIVRSGNMSLGVNLLAALVEEAASALGAGAFDIEIAEMHHRRKVDAPSGTALLLGEAAARGRGVALEDVAVRTRDGHTGPRPAGAIGFATLRGGTVVGEHTVMFAGEGERIELTHRAEDRAVFARGALAAALWARGQPPGLYSMRDVLGIAR